MRKNNFLIGVFAVLLVIGSVIYVTLNRRLADDSGSLPRQITGSKARELVDISKDCSGIPTVSSAEGPFYTPNTPERVNIAPSSNAEKLVVRGFVFDINCEPISGVWLDFWQADEKGEYDNTGYNLRGHQYTDETGKYRLETIVPSGYGSRPPHIHVKVWESMASPILITQMYIQGETRGQTDSIFNESLVVSFSEEEGRKIATFDFVLE